MMPLLKQGKHKQLPERHSSGTQQPQQNIKSNLKSHVKKKKTNKIKLWFFPLTFSYQNPQSHYVYGSLCSSFFLQQSFDWQLLGSYCNLIYLSSLWSFCFVSSFNCFYTKGKKNIHFLLLFLLSFFFFFKSWTALYISLYFSKFYHFREESHIFKRMKSKGAWLQLFVFQWEWKNL